MGFFSKKDKNAYGEYANELFEENYTLSDEGILPIGQRQNVNFSSYALTPDEVKGNEPQTPVEDIPMQSAGESLYRRMMARNEETVKKSVEVKEQAESLLSRCSQFVSDDKKGSALPSQPAYTLASVEDIIAEAEKRAQDRVKKIYGSETVETPAPVKSESAIPVSPAPVAKEQKTEVIKPVSDVKTQKTVPVNAESTIKETSLDATIEMPAIQPEIISMTRDTDIKSYQYRFADEELTPPPSHSEEEALGGSTISFIPLKQETASLADDVRASLEMVDISSGKKEHIPEAEDEFFGDYFSVDDAEEIRKTLKKKHNALRVRSLLSMIPAAILLLLFLPFMSATKETAPISFILFEAILTAASAIIGFDIFKGLAALFGKKSNADLPLALCTIAALGFSVYCVLTATNYMQFGVIAAVGIVCSLHYKRRTAKRIIKNFEEIANSEEKFAVELIDEEHGSYAIAHDAVEGEALIAAGKKTVNIHDFLKNSYCDDPTAPKITAVSIISLAVALIMLVYGIITSDVATALSVLVSVLAIASPFSSNILGNLPLYLAALHLNKNGAMLSGHKATEDIEQVNAVVFDIGSIFPRGTVKMFDMKVLSPNDLERTIFNAAAVTTSINSPLGHVFRRIARTSEEYVLPPADSVKYENRLGISGWVGDHSLLIGNRTLMETHGVAVPSIEVDKKILRNGYFPVYVASDGKPCALLIVGYEDRDDIATELHRLCNTGVTLLINNCDPNVTEEMLCDYFGLPEGFVKLMQSGSVRKYQDMTEYSENTSAGAAYDGSAAGLASTVTAAIKVKKLTSVMSVLHIMLLVIGLVAAIVLAVTGRFDILTPLHILIYSAASALLVRLTAFLSRP